MDYAEEFFKQVVVKNNSSCKGFSVLVTLAGLTIVACYYIIKFIITKIKEVLKEREIMLKEQEEENIKLEAHSKAVNRLLKLLTISNNVINFNIIKSHTNRSTGELTQHINFVVFNEETRNVEIINLLLNEVLHDTLTICNSKDIDLKGTVITKDFEIDIIRENLIQVTGKNIILRNF